MTCLAYFFGKVEKVGMLFKLILVTFCLDCSTSFIEEKIIYTIILREMTKWMAQPYSISSVSCTQKPAAVSGDHYLAIQDRSFSSVVPLLS